MPAPETSGASPQQGANLSTGGGAAPVMGYGMTFREVGQTGLRAFSGWVREEFLPQLMGRQGVQKYREMADNSPVIGAVLFAINAVMRKVNWRVDPADDSPEAAETADFIDSCRDDMSHTWEDGIVEDLSMLQYGFCVKEIVYKKRQGRDPAGQDRFGEPLPSSAYDDGRIGWRRLPNRGQDTIIKWFFDPNGGIKGMTQQPWMGGLVDIPVEKFLLFRPAHQKGNPEGRSILRSAYLPYYFAKRMQEQEAILGERMGGLPVVSVPADLIQRASAGDADAVQAMTAYKKIVQNIRIDEQMGLILPSDPYEGANGPSSIPKFKFELVTPQGGASKSALDFGASIGRYNLQMMTCALADFVSMGHDARGAQNLGETKVDLFYGAVEGFLNSNAAVYNRYAFPRLLKLNGMNLDAGPKLVPEMARRIDLDGLSMFLLRLSQCGMPLFPNDELQAALLDSAGLPDITDDRAMQAAGLLDDQLALEDEKGQVALDRMKEPPQPPAPTQLQKMLAGSFARRMIRHAGPRFGIVTKRGGWDRHAHSHAGGAPVPATALAEAEAALAKARGGRDA